MNDIRSVAIAFKVWSRCSKVSFSIFHLKDTLCSPDRFLWCGWCAARRLLVFRCEFDDFDGNPTQFTPLNTSWWQSLVQVLRGCAELLPLLCGATTTNTILQSYFCNYCAELLMLSLLLCRASTTVQSFYYYYCAEREGTVSPIISRWRRIATTDQKQLKTMNNSTMLLATMIMERKPSHPPTMFVIHKKWMKYGETVWLGS